MIRSTCPHCQAKFTVKNEYLGRSISCPKCWKPFTIAKTASTKPSSAQQESAEDEPGSEQQPIGSPSRPRRQQPTDTRRPPVEQSVPESQEAASPDAAAEETRPVRTERRAVFAKALAVVAGLPVLAKAGLGIGTAAALTVAVVIGTAENKNSSGSASATDGSALVETGRKLRASRDGHTAQGSHSAQGSRSQEGSGSEGLSGDHVSRSEFDNAAALASQVYKVNGRPILGLGRTMTERLKSSSHQPIRLAATDADHALMAYLAAMELRKQAARAQDVATTRFLQGLSHSLRSSGPILSVDDLNRLYYHDALADRYQGEAVAKFVESMGAGVTSAKLFQKADQLRRSAWDRLLPMARQYAGTDSPQQAAIDLRIRPLSKRDFDNGTQLLLSALFRKGKRRVFALLATNRSGRDLSAVTLAVNLTAVRSSAEVSVVRGVRVSGTKEHDNYFIHRWPAGKTIELVTGVNWTSAALRKTFEGNWSLWSNELHQENHPQRFLENLRLYATEELAAAERALWSKGDSAGALATAREVLGLLGDLSGFDSLRSQARKLLADAKRMDQNLAALREATSAGKESSGLWVFGKFTAPVLLRFIETAKGRRGTRTIEAHLIDPAKQPLYRPLFGRLQYSPQAKRWLLVLKGNSLDRRGLTDRVGLGKARPPSLANLLQVRDTRIYRLVFADGMLRGNTPLGDELQLFDTQRKDAAAGIKSLSTTPLAPLRLFEPNPMEPIPAKWLPPPFDGQPLKFEHQVGEIRRMVGRRIGGAGVRGFPIDRVWFHSRQPQVMSLGYQYEVLVWNLRTGKPLANFRVNNNHSPVAASPDFRAVAVGQPRYVDYYDTKSKKRSGSRSGPVASRLKVPSGGAVAFSTSPSGPRLISGAMSGELYVWNKSGKPLLTGNHGAAVTAVAGSADGSLVFAGTADKKISIWNMKTGKFLRTFDDMEFPAQQIDPTPDGSRVLCVSQVTGRARFGGTRSQAYYQIRIWDTQSLKTVYHARLPREAAAVAISSDWRRALLAGRDGQVYLWDLTRGREIHRFVGHQERVMSVAFSPDGRFAVSGGHDIWVILWGLPTAVCIRKVGGK